MGYLIVGVLTVFIVYWFSFRTKEKERVVDVFVGHGPLDYFVTYDPAKDGGDGSMSLSKPVVIKKHKDGTYEYKRNTDNQLNLLNPLWYDSSSDWNDGSFPSHNSPAQSNYDSGSSSDSSSSYDSGDSGSSDCGGGDSGD